MPDEKEKEKDSDTPIEPESPMPKKEDDILDDLDDIDKRIDEAEKYKKRDEKEGE